jgi:hypothetical protein
MPGEITLTSRFGQFTFDKTVILSHAKLIRDTVTGQFFHPKDGEPKMRTVEEALMYVANYCGKLGDIPFTLTISIKKQPFEWRYNPSN